MNAKSYITFEEAAVFRIYSINKTESSNIPRFNNSSRRTFIESRWNGNLYYYVADSLFLFEFSPSLLVRQLEIASLPIKSPDYKLTTKVHYQIGDNKENNIDSKMQFLSLQYQHHSNGLSGDFCLDSSENNCTVNLEGGNFSINSIQLAFNHVYGSHKAKLFFKHGFEFNIPSKWTKDQEKYYNDIRLKNNFQLLFRQKRNIHQLSFNLDLLMEEFKFDKLVDGSLINTNLEYFFQPYFLKKARLSFFCRLYSGEDYYNIYFIEKLMALRLGIALYNFPK